MGKKRLPEYKLGSRTQLRREIAAKQANREATNKQQHSINLAPGIREEPTSLGWRELTPSPWQEVCPLHHATPPCRFWVNKQTFKEPGKSIATKRKDNYIT